MKQILPEVSFERSMNHNYMILSRCDFFGAESSKGGDYRTRMLLENRIPGLLPVTHRLINGESRYYYEINSLQSLDRMYDKKEIHYGELRSLLAGCVDLFDRLEEYLLDGTQVIIRPEFIYIDVERMEPYFVCYPDYEGDVRLSFMEFADGLLTKIDHTDAGAVMLGYQVYRYTRNPNYVLCEIRRMMESMRAEMAGAGTGLPEKRPEPAQEFNAGRAADPGNDFPEWELHKSRFLPYETVSTEKTERMPPKKGNLLGGLLCLLLSLCVGVVLLCAGIWKGFQASMESELYLYGVMTMAAVAAVLFFSCHIRQIRHYKAIGDLGRERGKEEKGAQEGIVQCRQPIGNGCQGSGEVRFSRQEPGSGHDTAEPRIRRMAPAVHDGTICLGSGIVEERVLYGRTNGKEIHISLDKLPLTIGKMEGLADFVINDATVSKMHARFEERDGRVFVCDLNSTNGTVRNGVLLGVNQSAPLEPGDRLRFGRSSFTYC